MTVRYVSRLIWAAVRLPTHTLLAFFAPVVSLLLGSLALLCVASAAAWALEGQLGGAPACGLLACAVGILGLLGLYRLLLRLMAS